MRKSTEFVRKWVNRYKIVKNVDDFEGRGKKRGTIERQDKVILRLFEKNPSLTLRQAQKQLEKKGIKLAISTIKRRLEDSDIKYRSTLQKPLLSEKHVSMRYAWAQKNISRNWDNVIFSDESSFWAWVLKKRAWTSKGNPMLQRTVKHPVKVHV